MSEEFPDVIAKLPTKELRIEMVLNPTGEIITNTKFSAFREGPVSEAWISAFLEKPALFVRSAPNEIKPLN